MDEGAKTLVLLSAEVPGSMLNLNISPTSQRTMTAFQDNKNNAVDKTEAAANWRQKITSESESRLKNREAVRKGKIRQLVSNPKRRVPLKIKVSSPIISKPEALVSTSELAMTPGYETTSPATVDLDDKQWQQKLTSDLATLSSPPGCTFHGALAVFDTHSHTFTDTEIKSFANPRFAFFI
jgi:hypothetical protein